MVFDLSKIGGLGDYQTKLEPKRTLYLKHDKVFLVVNANTIEVRCDEKLAAHLKSKYESVMQSRYFGQGGIEIVLAEQLNREEIDDLVRLSYNITS